MTDQPSSSEPDGPALSDPLADVTHALAVLTAQATDPDQGPLQARLLILQEGVDDLLARYAAAERDPRRPDLAAAPAPSFEAIKADYARLFSTCTVAPAHAGEVAWRRRMLLKGRPRYEEASAATGVPWWFIGIVHGLEASFNFNGHLHNGDPLTAKTVQVPAGRPDPWLPPSGWLASAKDALELEGLLDQADWSVERCLYRWEAYNGWGYRPRHINSPYVWSFSNHYTAGKYVADGRFDPNAVSRQCGAAVMLKALQNAGDVAL
jgi:lysozyme family protein